MGQKIVTKLRKYSSSQRHRVNSVAYSSPVPGRRFCNDTARINANVPLSLANFQSATYPSTASPTNIVFLTTRCMLGDNWARKTRGRLLLKKLFLSVIAPSWKSCSRLHASADKSVQSWRAQLLHQLLSRLELRKLSQNAISMQCMTIGAGRNSVGPVSPFRPYSRI